MVRNIWSVVSLIILMSSQAFAWGAKGHQIVAYVGADLATGLSVEGQDFWRSNEDIMRTLSTVPDRVWKLKNTAVDEKPTHWFQADAYYDDTSNGELMSFPKEYDDAVSKYTEKTILVNGTAPWRVRQFYGLAVDAMKSGDVKHAIQYVGVMSHYIGDLSQPLHVSENYDGKDTGNDGIHKFFETTNIADEMSIRKEVNKRAKVLLADPSFTSQFSGDLMDTMYLEISRSLAHRDEVLSNDTDLGRKGDGKKAQLDLAEDRMADGAATMAIILGKLWTEAGVSIHATPVTVADPKWVEPDYSSLSQRMTPLVADSLEDDCND